MIPDLGEDMIIGTEYDTFVYLLNTAYQDYMTDLWWKEAHFVSSKIGEHIIQMKLSKKQKRKQKQGYQRPSDGTDPKAIMSVAGRIPDPDVLWAGHTQKTLRLTTGNCSRFENINSVEVDGEGDFGQKEVEEESGRGDQIGKADSDGGDVCGGGGDGGGRTGWSSPVEILPRDSQGRS
ncbi:hypothetical protein NDU88_003674 [Pleurodeles waltl]|uniref:Uncharacterized protein n=1 Tax=Pleurodeles waltl TaxID=8319 RepID=A0AAV7UFV7_PLEWA|nr:hypothetical protein NDU88_003674 [Pleurodeles waltl]